MPWHEKIDNLAWMPLKNVAEGVAISKVLGVEFEKGATGASELRWAVAVIQPGGRFSHHAHPHPQCFYFVSGEGEVATDAGVLPVGPGHIVTLDDDEGHEVRNTGPGEMYLMEVSLMHPKGSVPKVQPHPAVAAEDARQPGLALRLHSAVKETVDAAGAAAGAPEAAAGAPEAAAPHAATEAAVPARTAATWLQAARLFSLTASVIPVLLGTALGAVVGGVFRPGLGLAALLGASMLHIGSNLFSDYYDYRHGVDREDTHGSSGVITGGLLPPQEVFLGGLFAFAVAAAMGVLIALATDWRVIVGLGLTGLVGGYFYSGKPVGLKYRGLGDLVIFALFGPLMVLGAWYVQTGTLTWLPLAVAVPVGFLVTAILHANNLRDISHDRRAGIRTLAMLVGESGSKGLYAALVVGAYVAVVVLAAFGLVPWAALLVVLSAPIALRNVKHVQRSRGMADIVTADVMTAQLHLVFGVLLIGGVVLGTFI